MSLDIYFVYDTEAELEVRQVGCRGLQDLFDFPSQHLELQNSILDPPFVQDFPKSQDWEPIDIDIDSITDEEWDEMLEPYVGPTFAPSELVTWASSWLDILEDLTIEERGLIFPLAFYDSAWMPNLLDDLKAILEQARHAQRHNISMYIEMY